jgi:hypothetical protein
LLLWHENWGGEVHCRVHILLLLLLMVCTVSSMSMWEHGGWRGELKTASVTTLHGSSRDLCSCGWLSIDPIM